MSAWTWTSVKAKFIPKDIVDKIITKSIKEIEGIWYMSSKKSAEKIQKEWLDMHTKEYDYYVNECGVNPEDMTEKKLLEKLSRLIENGKSKISDLGLILGGKLTLDQYCRKYKTWRNYMSELRTEYWKGSVWVEVPEIFRYRFYSDFDNVGEGLKTVDSLLDFLRRGNQGSIQDYNDLEPGLTENLEKRIREYYGQFGDGNFSVTFG